MASPPSDTMNRFSKSLADAQTYPRNMGNIESRSRALLKQLDDRSPYIFCQENKAAVTFMDLSKFDYAKSDRGYATHTIHSTNSLDNHLGLTASPHRQDPRQRFIFIGAKNGRSALHITRAMFLQLLTYTQVNPGFLNFVFPFGRQLYTRDFHVSGYRSESCRSKADPSMKLPSMGRSGRHIEICYNLKSAERQHAPGSPTTGLQAWSVRQCSVHHKFDLETQQMSWIIINANGVVRGAVAAQLLRAEGTDGPGGLTPPSQWETAFEVHRTITSWAGENWQWYLNELQNVLEEKTRRIRSIPHTSVTADSSYSSPVSSQALQSPAKRSRRGWSMRSISKGALGGLRRASSAASWRASTQVPITNDTGVFTAEPETIAEGPLMDAAAADDLQFSDLQTIQWLEDEANSALLILKANASVMNDLSVEYDFLQDGSGNTQNIAAEELERLAHHLRSMGSDFGMEQSRLEFMLRVLADRKSLLHGILQCRNMEFNKLLAEEAQLRAENMEYMTQKMHDIAQKTQLETVSMKTITLVTLFFLPGTFISTLMSTPIVAFSDNETSSFSLNSNVGIGALKLYLAFSLPCVALTFLVWAAMYRWEQRKEARSEQHRYPGDEECGTISRLSDEMRAIRFSGGSTMVSSGRKQI